MNIWVIVRLALVAIYFFLNLRAGPQAVEGIEEAPPLLLLVFGVIAVPFVVSIRRIRPGKPFWNYPGWQRNPFNLQQPLQFFHFAGWFFMAMGAGLAAHALRTGVPVSNMALVWLAFGAGVLAGAHLSTRIYRGRMVER